MASFGGATPRRLPQNGPPKKLIFCLAQNKVPVFLISTDSLQTHISTYFGGATSPRGPPQAGPPKISSSPPSNLRYLCF